MTEAMVQIRERSRWARRTGSDGKDSCDHVQHTERGVVSSASSRRSTKRSSVGKVPESTSSGSRKLAQTLLLSLDKSLTTVSSAREKEKTGFQKF